MARFGLSRWINKDDSEVEMVLEVSMVAYLGTNYLSQQDSIAIGFSTESGKMYSKIYNLNLKKGSELYVDLTKICGNLSFMKEDYDLFQILGHQVIGTLFMGLEIKKCREKYISYNIPHYIFSFEETSDFNKLPDEVVRIIKNSKQWRSNYMMQELD